MSGKLHLSLHFRKPLPSEPQDHLLAGVAQRDITPPPGIPKGGYSAMAKIASGFRTRLKVKAFYIKPVDAAPVLLLQADLHAGSTVLRDVVAEALTSQTDIPASNVCLTCTHTHAGPGQLLESDFYNDHASSKPGLDPELLDFVSQQMIAAACAAYADRKPARIATGACDLWGSSRNRALPAYINNVNHQQTPLDRFRAINPRLFMLRIDQQTAQGGFAPRAAFSSFSIHGTSVPVDVTDFNADLWAYVERQLEHRIQQRHATPWPVIHGPCQGTHGDIAPNIRQGEAGYLEARRLGSQIGEQAIDLFESLGNQLQDTFVVRTAIELVDAYATEQFATPLASRPVVGNALVAGAFENSTPVLYHTPFFKHGPTSRRWWFTQGEQGHKRWLGSVLQPLILAKQNFPHLLTLQLVQLGDWVLVAVPFEVTVEAGRRIAASVEQHYANRPVNAVVTSLANGYTGYTTTPEEYAKQHYEGGHTLYGPNSTPWLCERYGVLARDLGTATAVSRFPATREYHLKQRHYWPRRSVDKPQSWQWQGAAAFKPAKPNREAYWAWDFVADAPGAIAFHEPIAHLEEQTSTTQWQPAYRDGIPLSDDGYDIGIKYLGFNKSLRRHHYQVRWYNPQTAAQPMRLVVRNPATGEQLQSLVPVNLSRASA